MSIDALRGFDMFWIIGGDAIAGNLGLMFHIPLLEATMAQLSNHVEWAGFRFYDMIFPLFLFIIGATLPFSLGKHMEQGVPKGELIKKSMSRTAILFFFGLLYNGALDLKGWDHLRIFGVLQRQALGYGIAAILFLTTSRRTQVILFFSILIGYWALMALVHVPGAHGGIYSEWGNMANAVDRLILRPGQMYEKYGDPEGPVSLIPAISTALLGIFAGTWLKSSRTEGQKVLGLFVAGLICIAVGLAWSPFFPIIKKIWTSSYMLVAGGCSLELLALFYFVVDVKGFKKLAFPFVVIGVNSITIYMVSRIVRFDDVAKFFVSGLAALYPHSKDIILATGVVVAEWLFLYLLYRKKMFLKV